MSQDAEYGRLFDELQQAEAEIRDLERKLQDCRTALQAAAAARDRWAQQAQDYGRGIRIAAGTMQGNSTIDDDLKALGTALARAEAAERERDAIEAKWLRVNDMISEVFLTLTAKIATDRSPEAYAAAKDVIRAVLKVAAPGITLEDLIGPMVEEKPCPHVSRTPFVPHSEETRRFFSQCVQCGEKLELRPTRTWE